MADTPDVEHYLSMDQVLKRAWDVDSQALKIVQQSQEFAVDVRAADGDSVMAVADCVTLSDMNPIACGSMRRCNLFGNATVMVSPLDSGDGFVALAMSGITEICAKRVKLVIPEGEEAHLVLQS